jgi:hypothetical protein
MWPFTKQDAVEEKQTNAEAFVAAVMNRALLEIQNKMALERFLLIHDAMPIVRKEKPDIDCSDLGANAIACIVNQVFRLEKIDYLSLPKGQLLFKFALMVSMADIISQRTGGKFELTAFLAHTHFMSAFVDGPENVAGTKDAALFSTKACHMNTLLLSSESGAKVVTHCALATWRWISENDKEALFVLCDILGPRGRR